MQPWNWFLLFEQAIDNLENRLTVMAEEREEEKTSLTEKLRQVFLKLKNHLQGFSLKKYFKLMV